MTEHYGLWDRESGNVIGTYPTKRAAYGAVASFVRANGPAVADDLLLVRESEAGIPTAIASGIGLVLEATLAELEVAEARARALTGNEYSPSAPGSGWTVELDVTRTQTEPREESERANTPTPPETPVRAGNRQSTLAKAA